MICQHRQVGRQRPLPNRVIYRQAPHGRIESLLARLSIMLVLCLGGCASTNHDSSQLTPTLDAEAADLAWRFDFVDTTDAPIGYMVLAFTDEKIDEPACGRNEWAKMLVLEDSLDIDFGVVPQPAYLILGPWLRIDLTASVCYLNHNLIGDISPDGASGHFTLTHKIGGSYLGKFTASPVSKVTGGQPKKVSEKTVWGSFLPNAEIQRSGGQEQ